MSVIFSSVAQGLLWSVMAIGVYITFRILHLADLSAEGSFPLGASVSAVLIVNGVHPLLATAAAGVAGMVAGAVAGFLHTKMKIPSLLTGILVLTGLYSINLRILGQANVSLLNQNTVISSLRALGLSRMGAAMSSGLLAIVLVMIVLNWFFRTAAGLALRATGNNETMAEANSINTDLMKIVGYTISNGCIALSGSLIAQMNVYADVTMGIGTIVIGLASVIIAEVLFRPSKLIWVFPAIVIGSTLYRLIIDLVLNVGVQPQDIKLFSAIILAIILWLPESNLLNRMIRKKV